MMRRRNRRQWTGEGQDRHEPELPSDDSSVVKETDLSPDSDEEPYTNTDETMSALADSQKTCTVFVLNTRAKSNLSQKYVNTVVEGVQQYQSSLLDTSGRNGGCAQGAFQKLLKSTGERCSKIFDKFVDPFAEVEQPTDRTV
ncbi:hypothetical protein WMY93_025697 [Mugilogobius chulae]|uniref:Uncharacterized protein n=1 Tax=Mugilogobius chulae TaxID=88201 RepID=A0AAW0N5P1_9GOBI